VQAIDHIHQTIPALLVSASFTIVTCPEGTLQIALVSGSRFPLHHADSMGTGHRDRQSEPFQQYPRVRTRGAGMQCGAVAQHRLVPVQATQQSNAPGTSVLQGFHSARWTALDAL
jgi:hypothetical protein